MATTAPDNEDLDDLFNYDVGIEDILNEASKTNDASSSNNQNKAAPTKNTSDVLGLDEEVVVEKKRKPTVKFDEARWDMGMFLDMKWRLRTNFVCYRLLSAAGIPKLRKTAKQKLKFKGKGHEVWVGFSTTACLFGNSTIDTNFPHEQFSDAARLLNFYQLWLDDLFPRAKFADGLSMIEKLGHSKRIQVMRREWIDEGKPRLYNDDVQNNESNSTNANGPSTSLPDRTTNDASGEQQDTTQSGDSGTTLPSENVVSSIFGGGSGVPRKSSTNDDLDLFMTDEEDNNAAPKAPEVPEVPEEDDLDALLAEQESMEAESSRNPPATNNASSTGPGAQRPPDDDDFEDEMEAMAGMDNPW